MPPHATVAGQVVFVVVDQLADSLCNSTLVRSPRPTCLAAVVPRACCCHAVPCGVRAPPPLLTRPRAPPPTHVSPQQVVATAQALLANGGVMAPVGTHIVAMAARRHSVPFVVLCGIYKLSTLFPHNPGGWPATHCASCRGAERWGGA